MHVKMFLLRNIKKRNYGTTQKNMMDERKNETAYDRLYKIGKEKLRT
jgi:hypothetical protein